MKSGSTVGLRIVLDGSQLNREIAKSRRELKGLGDDVEAESGRMGRAFTGIGRSLAGIAGAWSLKGVASEVVKVRGEIEQLEVSFTTMLGSASKGRAMMGALTEFASTTPYGLTDSAGAAKQLIAYGMEGEKVVETLRRIGDVSAGLSIPLGEMAYLYGTTMVQGRLYTADLNQFLSRGIPLVGELAKQFGVAESEVKGLVEAGKVGFEHVERAIESLTSAGGQFGGLMAAQSETVTGRLSALEDSYKMMLNEMGESSEGLIYGAIDVAAKLVENYEVVGDVLLTLVADYGVYKGTLMAVTAYTRACYSYEIAQLRSVVAEKGAEIDADLAGAVSKGRMTAQRAAEVQALRQKNQNATALTSGSIQ